MNVETKIDPTSSKPTEMSAEEWETRIDLAACYRMIRHFGMDDLIYTHISARVPGPEEHFLLNPFGLLYEEVTASNLVKVDLNGDSVEDYLVFSMDVFLLYTLDNGPLFP